MTEEKKKKGLWWKILIGVLGCLFIFQMGVIEGSGNDQIPLEVQTDLADMSAKIDRQKDQIDDLTDENSKLVAQRDELGRLLEAESGIREETRKELEAAKQAGIDKAIAEREEKEARSGASAQ